MRSDVFFCMFLMICRRCLADYYQNSNYYCTNLNPQRFMEISQLEGIWYVKEKIIHTEERNHVVANVTTCPVIHLAIDRGRSIILKRPYDTTYGSGYFYEANSEDPRFTVASEREQEEYDRRTTYDPKRRKINHTEYIKQLYALKNLRIFWDENGNSTEYHLRYNVSQPGFWISSGPEGRTPDDLKYFAGTVQVIKALGNHLVLTFCESQPEKNQLFTVILSREHFPDSRDSIDIHNVHGLLIRKGLTTNAIEQYCNKAPSNGLTLVLGVFILGIYTFYFVK